MTGEDIGNSSSSSSHPTTAVTHLHRDINRRIVDANSVTKVLNIVEANSQDFNAVNISTAFHRLARMWRDLPDLNASSNGQTRLDGALQTLMRLAVRHIKQVQGQGLGIIIWALAKICYDPVRIRFLLQAFAQEAIDRLTDGVPKNEPNLKLGPQSLSNMVYAYAVMGHHPGEDLLTAIAQGAHAQLTDFSPQGLSNLVWAYAKLAALPAASMRAGQDESTGLDLRAKGNLGRLLDALALEAVNQLMDTRSSHKFIPQNLSNMVYGYAMLGHEPGAMLLLAVARQALLQLDNFSPQELTNMVWAYAKLLPPGQPLFGPPQALLNAVPQHVVRQLADDAQHHKVKPQTVSNLLWAYATLGWAPTHLLNSLALETLRQLPYFKPQELANTLWSYATLGYTPMPEWLVQMGVACEGQVGGCKPQELSSLVWALGSLRLHPGAACLSTATETASRVLDKLKAAEVCNLVWGLAQLGCYPDADLLQRVVQASQDWTEGVGPVEVCRLLWGLAVLDHLPKTAAESLYQKLATLHLASLTAESLDQILQVDAFLECSSGSLKHVLPPQLQHALQLTFVNNMQQHQPSQMLNEISAGLFALSIPHSAPYLVEQGPLLVDVALLGPCPAIALQVEDPGQLAVNAPWLPLGATRLKQQTLRSKGWQVVSIPFHIWSMLGTLPLRAAYLQQLLHICQVLQFQPSPPTPLTHLKGGARHTTSSTYSNSNIEAINSALAAQWANPAYNRGASMGVTQHAPPHSSAAAEAASQLSSLDSSGTLVHQRTADANERPASSMKQQTMSVCPAYERLFHSVPALSPHGSMPAPLLQGRAHTSPAQPGRGFAQLGGSPSQGAMQCSGSRTGAAAAMGQSVGTAQSPWAGSEAGKLAEQGQGVQQAQEAWSGQGQGLEVWTGQALASPRDGPLNAAEYEAVMNLQSLALQLQAAGLQQRHGQELMGANQAGAFPSTHHQGVHYNESDAAAAADHANFMYNYSRSCQSPTHDMPQLAHDFGSPSHTVHPGSFDSTDDLGHTWRPTLPQILSAHCPPWSPARPQHSSMTSQAIPCVVLQAAGYAPRFAQQDASCK